MKIITVACVLSVLFLWTWTGQSEIVNYKPKITDYNFTGKVTTNTVILKQPQCYFDNLTNLTCTSAECEIWLVPTVNSAVNTFDADKTDPSILTLSPYPTAITDNSSKNYFLTKLGLQKDFPCSSSSGIAYIRVGSDGSCSTANCNGVLPVGSTVRFKYLLVDPHNKTILAETKWSDNITLYTLKDPETIDDGLAARFASMIVITSILSIAMTLLITLLLIMLILALCCSERTEPIPTLGSLHLPEYDTHHLKDPVPYVNPSYVDDVKMYAISAT